MVAIAGTPSKKYEYLVLAFQLRDSELELWEVLTGQNKADLSRMVYSMIAQELPALKKSALQRLSRTENVQATRRMFLYILPEFEQIIRFIRANIRRPAFKAHLKSLLLYGESKLDCLEAASEPLLNQPKEVPAREARERQPVLRSPRDLFSDPGNLVKTMFVELKKAKDERLFDWDGIPPDDYPEEVKAARLFGLLRAYWNEKR